MSHDEHILSHDEHTLSRNEYTPSLDEPRQPSSLPPRLGSDSSGELTPHTFHSLMDVGMSHDIDILLTPGYWYVT